MFYWQRGLIFGYSDIILAKKEREKLNILSRRFERLKIFWKYLRKTLLRKSKNATVDELSNLITGKKRKKVKKIKVNRSETVEQQDIIIISSSSEPVIVTEIIEPVEEKPPKTFDIKINKKDSGVLKIMEL